MHDLYSLTLFVALVLAGTGALSGVFVLCRSGDALRPVALLCVVLAPVFGVVSFAVHLRYGHGPGTPEPMDLGQFLGIHPAYLVVLILSIFGAVTTFLSRKRTSRKNSASARI
jgi:hypothetical protein